ncbi:MAG TPA: lipopolysaccharide kinase InaA family protein, partial [Deltaproteobacteria bacterium]|nr:lipopolysaccharide kinase InaA family protein [Deltaproteobacteria bacterium]
GMTGMNTDLENLGYAVRRLPPYTVIYKQSHPHLKELVSDHAVLGRQTSITGRSVIRIIEPDLVVRTLTHGGMLRRLTGPRFLGIGRSLRELRVSAYLISHNILTPEIMAVRYMKKGIFSYIDVVSRLVPGSIDLLTYLEKPSGDGLALLRQTGRLVCEVHRTGVYHTDLHVKNILLGKDKSPWIIDLDNAYRFSNLPALLKRRNISRFLHSLKKWEGRKRILLPDGWQEAFLDGYTSNG